LMVGAWVSLRATAPFLVVGVLIYLATKISFIDMLTWAASILIKLLAGILFMVVLLAGIAFAAGGRGFGQDDWHRLTREAGRLVDQASDLWDKVVDRASGLPERVGAEWRSALDSFDRILHNLWHPAGIQEEIFFDREYKSYVRDYPSVTLDLVQCLPNEYLVYVAREVGLELQEVGSGGLNLSGYLSHNSGDPSRQDHEWELFEEQLLLEEDLQRMFREALMTKLERQDPVREIFSRLPIVDSGGFRNETDRRLGSARIKLREEGSNNYDHLSRLDSEASLRTAIAAPVVVAVAGVLQMILVDWEASVVVQLLSWVAALIPGYLLIFSAERMSREMRGIIQDGLEYDFMGEYPEYGEHLIFLRN
jgi:hypothetical protein